MKTAYEEKLKEIKETVQDIMNANKLHGRIATTESLVAMVILVMEIMNAKK